MHISEIMFGAPGIVLPGALALRACSICELKTCFQPANCRRRVFILFWRKNDNFCMWIMILTWVTNTVWTQFFEKKFDVNSIEFWRKKTCFFASDCICICESKLRANTIYLINQNNYEIIIHRKSYFWQKIVIYQRTKTLYVFSCELNFDMSTSCNNRSAGQRAKRVWRGFIA